MLRNCPRKARKTRKNRAPYVSRFTACIFPILTMGFYSLFLYPVFFRAFRAFRGLRFFIRYMRNISYLNCAPQKLNRHIYPTLTKLDQLVLSQRLLSRYCLTKSPYRSTYDSTICSAVKCCQYLFSARSPIVAASSGCSHR